VLHSNGKQYSAIVNTAGINACLQSLFQSTPDTSQTAHRHVSIDINQ